MQSSAPIFYDAYCQYGWTIASSRNCNDIERHLKESKTNLYFGQVYLTTHRFGYFPFIDFHQTWQKQVN